jgi:antitoxin (DNA-binding transcriptional repressor) of toxin-antitoxin stability system
MSALLTLIALGLLMGARDMKGIWNKVAGLTQKQRELIGLTVREKNSPRLHMPGYDCLNDFMNLLSAQDFANVLTRWLQSNQGNLPASLALDGKSIGNAKAGMIITLCRHEDGRPVALIPATGKKEDSEVSQARKLLKDPSVNLVNKTITLDPLHNKHETLDTITKKGGDYIVGTKENTSKRLSAAQSTLLDTPFLASSQKSDTAE